MLTSKCRSICFNLSDSKNPELRSRLLSGELSPAALVRLSSQEMASGSLRAQRHQWHAKRLKCAIRCAAAVSEPTRGPPLVAPPLCRSRWSTVRLVVCSPFAAGRSAASATGAICTVAIGANLIRLEPIELFVPASGKWTRRARISRASIATIGGRKEARDAGCDRSDSRDGVRRDWPLRLPARAVALGRLSHERLTRAYNCIAHGVRVCM